MTVLAVDMLRLCQTVLYSVGMSRDNADVVARHLVDSDLMGVRSHGVLRIPRYVEQIESGYIDVAATLEVSEISSVLLKIDARRNFGILAFDRLVPLLIERAKTFGIAGGAVVNCAHTGRIGAYTEAAAKAFTWSQVFGGGGNEKLKEVAPFGGARGVFDTNPYALSLPIDTDEITTADFATSATAQGKLLVYRTNKEPVPEGWLIDKTGRPTRSAEDFYAGGAMLPSAGPKGYGLAFVAELFGDAVLGTPHELNWFMVVVDLARYTDRASYFKKAKKLQAEVEECPPLEGFPKVMWPGQPEVEKKSRQSVDGIAYSQQEMGIIADLFRRFNLDAPVQ